MDDHCFQPSPPAPGIVPSGSVEQWDDLNLYVVCPSTPTAAAAVILISDVFGWEAPLLRKLADKVAKHGYMVVVPDLLYGDVYDPARTVKEEWIQKHNPEGKPTDDLKKIIQALELKGIKTIGIAGFCWGAKVAVKSNATTVKAVALLHPSRVTTDDLEGLQVLGVPTAILAAEIDNATPLSLVEAYRKVLDSKEGLDHFVKVYDGVRHGWTVRYDEKDTEASCKAGAAHEDMISWFKKHL